MKRLPRHIAIMLLLCSLFTACSKSSLNNAAPKQTTVYVFGGEGPISSTVSGGYWTNNVYTPVDVPRQISAGCVSGNDVYAAGEQGKYFGYWKNGVFTQLDTLQADIVYGGYLDITPISMVVSGNDVYVLASRQLLVSNVISFVPVYWKNGKLNDFTNGNHEVEAINIFVSGSDVYISGNLLQNGNEAPMYWKNGSETNLAAASDQAFARQIFVSGNDVYVAGKKGKYAGYWKNGVFTALTDGSYQYASGRLIYVSGSDVYVAGYDGGITKYWKNGALAATLGTGDDNLVSMDVSGSDVYILGLQNQYTVVYWKNGAPTYLTDGISSYGFAASISVTVN